MVYNPPRPGKPAHKKKGATQHSKDEDNAFFEKRLKELKKLYDKTPATDKSRRAYYGGQIKSIDRRLHPEKYDENGQLKKEHKPKSIRHFKQGVDARGKSYIDAGNGAINGDIDQWVEKVKNG